MSWLTFGQCLHWIMNYEIHVYVYVRWDSTNFWGLIGIYLVHHYVTRKNAEVRVWGRAIWFLGKCREHRWRLSRYQWGSSWTVMDHLRQERLVMQLMQPCSIVWTGHHLIIIILSASRWSSGDCLDQDNHRVDMEGQEHGRENNLNNWPQAIYFNIASKYDLAYNDETRSPLSIVELF